MTLANTHQEAVGLIQRAIRMEEERAEAADAIKDLYVEAKSRGHDVAAMRAAVKVARETAEKRTKRETTEAIRDAMLAALGEDYARTPLGDAAVRAVS